MNNPLLHFGGLPQFDRIRPEHVTPAVEQLLEESRTLLAQLEADAAAPRWDNFVRPLEDAEERLGRAWAQVSHTNSVVNTPELREAYNANLSKLTAFYADLSQNEALYAKYKQLRAGADFERLSAAQRKIIENELRDFRLGGAELPQDKKARFKAIQEELSALSAKFEENVMDATDAYALFIEDESRLAGIPADALQAAREAAEKDGQGKDNKKPGWKFTLHFPSYMPVLQYADDRKLREQLYFAYATRASEFGKPELDNTGLIAQILKLRREAARLLGYDDYAQVSLATKMAQTPAQVMDFLRSLGSRARPFAERDMDELREFAAKLGLDELEAWDVAYVSEKLREERYAFSDQEVKQYFPEPQVLQGLFRVISSLYGVQVRKADAPVWHADVGFFEIVDRDGQLVGQFYLDLYARDKKRGGAWMDEAITRRRKVHGIETPVAFLTCNFSAPVGNKPALFTHDEVITLFHEFGHGLHHLLTKVEEYGVSGIKGVEWDAVELPSQFMENFCWEWDVLRHMTAHVDSGEPLPKPLYDKMVAAKNFQAGLQTLRQIEFALFDMRLHGEFDPQGSKTALDLLLEVRKEVAVVFPPVYNRFPNNFTHIFAGGYAAGYYSYKWAEVLSADAYSLFEENGVLSEETGRRFWSEILAQGGSRPALESFVAFRGREPTLDALLRHNGMVETAA
ncbi:MAG TPA: M3 family metallopeptidase [Novimethylophilus sp.]|uniref:M3 family metallopeptidase n=1 Tax=Novimethylophilus sp. TaxID=2137426 RepID=UPI002F3FE404